MPKCALPEHIDEASEWKGTDDDVWYMRWRLHIKGWFAFSFRCPKGITGMIIFLPLLYVLPFTIWFTGWSWLYLFPAIAVPVTKKWREFPVLIFALFGRGSARWESTDGKITLATDAMTMSWTPRFMPTVVNEYGREVVAQMYLSRVQTWARWHLQLQWPFLLGFHFYLKASDVPAPGTYQNTDGKLVGGYRGWHRDADGIFWGDSAFLGTVNK